MTDGAPGASRRRGLSLRWQLTLSYAGFLLVAGVVLVAVGLLLLRFVPNGQLQTIESQVAPNRSALLEVFARYATVGMVGLAVFGLTAGWLLAGRMLRRVAAITDVAERVRGGDLHRRIRMPGRSDELAELADTFDAMLGRVEASVDSHRRFSANAAHELRTPHAVMRTMLEVARADAAGRDVDLLIDRMQATNERAIALTEALLDLARADNGVDRAQQVDLARIVRTEVDRVAELAATRAVTVTTATAAAAMGGRDASASGDPALISLLVGNLLQNALVYNHEGGRVEIETGTDAVGRATIVVVNTGPVVAPAAAQTLAEPFVRATRRTRSVGSTHVGAGLGLAVVAAVVRAHEGALTLTPREGGGLIVEVVLPASTVVSTG